MLCQTTSESLTSDGSVICSHRDLLPPFLPHFRTSENGGGVRKDGGA